MCVCVCTYVYAYVYVHSRASCLFCMLKRVCLLTLICVLGQGYTETPIGMLSFSFFFSFFLFAGYVEALGQFTVKKFLFLVLFLDHAKLTRLIDHDPCLFVKSAAIKVSITGVVTVNCIHSCSSMQLPITLN